MKSKTRLLGLIGLVFLASCGTSQGEGDTSVASSQGTSTDTKSTELTQAMLDELARGYAVQTNVIYTVSSNNQKAKMLLPVDIQAVPGEVAIQTYPTANFEGDDVPGADRSEAETYSDLVKTEDGKVAQKTLTLANVLHQEVIQTYDANYNPVDLGWDDFGMEDYFEMLKVDNFSKAEDNTYTLNIASLDKENIPWLINSILGGDQYDENMKLESYSLTLANERIENFAAVISDVRAQNSTLINMEYAASGRFIGRGSDRIVTRNFFAPYDEGTKDEALENALKGIGPKFTEDFDISQIANKGQVDSSYNVTEATEPDASKAQWYAHVSLDYLNTWIGETYSDKDGEPQQSMQYYKVEKDGVTEWQQVVALQGSHGGEYVVNGDPMERNLPDFSKISSVFFQKQNDGSYLFEPSDYPELETVTTDAFDAYGFGYTLESATITLGEEGEVDMKLVFNHKVEMYGYVMAWIKGTLEITYTNSEDNPSDIYGSIDDVLQSGDDLKWSDYEFESGDENITTLSAAEDVFGGHEILDTLPVLGGKNNEAYSYYGKNGDNSILQYVVALGDSYQGVVDAYGAKAAKVAGWTYKAATGDDAGYSGTLTYGTPITKDGKTYSLTVDVGLAQPGNTIYLVLQPSLNEVKETGTAA